VRVRPSLDRSSLARRYFGTSWRLIGAEAGMSCGRGGGSRSSSNRLLNRKCKFNVKQGTRRVVLPGLRFLLFLYLLVDGIVGRLLSLFGVQKSFLHCEHADMRQEINLVSVDSAENVTVKNIRFPWSGTDSVTRVELRRLTRENRCSKSLEVERTRQTRRAAEIAARLWWT
jgi:hypothetical protein